MMPIATLDLDHSTLVLLSDDTDGFGFYVASEHTAVTWDDAGERFVIAALDGDDEIGTDELDELRADVIREFRHKGEDAGAVRCAALAGPSRGRSACTAMPLPPCAAQPAATPNPATPAEETHMLHITTDNLADGFASLMAAHEYLTERGINVALASVRLTGPEVVLSTRADGWATLNTVGGVWEVILKADGRATLRTDLGGVEVVFSSSEAALLALLPEAGLTVNFGAGAQVAA